MTPPRLLLGVDLGTSTIKADLYTTRGERVGAGAACVPLERPRPGWVEQDPRRIADAAMESIRVALATAHIQPDQVAGLAVSGHSPTLILVDGHGDPVGSAIVWQDQRATPEAAEIAERIGDRGPEILGATLPRSPSFAPARLLWLHRHSPERLARARWALEPKDYVRYCLSGEPASDRWSLKGLVNLQTGLPIHWPSVGLPIPDLAPRVLAPDEVAGRVAAGNSAGLPAGLPIATGWTDGLTAMLGTGILIDEGGGFLVSGTSEVVGMIAPGRIAGDPRVLEVPLSPLSGRVVMAPTQCGGAALVWFSDQILGVAVDRTIALAEEATDGMGGLLFLPYLEGERAPIWDPTARGVFFGIGSEHDRRHFARAVLEGVAFSVRHALAIVEAVAGRSVDHLRLAGGGARHAAWNQIIANVTGHVLQVTVADEPGTLGAALLAGVAARIWPDLASASGAAVRLREAVQPDLRDGGRYDAVYTTYRSLYPLLRDLFVSSARLSRQQR